MPVPTPQGRRRAGLAGQGGGITPQARQKSPQEGKRTMLPPIRVSHAAQRPAASRRAGGSGFALPAADGPPTAAPLESVMPFALLGLQHERTRAERDAAAERRGQGLMRELQALQLALLSGGPDPASLARVALLSEGEAGADPVLQEIIAAISLRARVELALHASPSCGQSREIASRPWTWPE